MFSSMLRLPLNVWILAATLSLVVASVPMLVLISGLLGAELAPTPELATLPVALSVIGLALAAIPAALIAKNIGRKRAGFLGISVSLAGSLCCALAPVFGKFYFLLIGALLIGSSTAFFQQFRFAAIESLHNKEDTGPALSVIMLCSIVAGILGPELGEAGRDLVKQDIPYTGSFLLLALLMLVAMAVFSFFKNPKFIEEMDDGPGRPLRNIIQQPLFLIAVAASLVGYAIMSSLMTSTPISMNVMHGHSLQDSKWVIQSHIVAMFAPSLFSGVLIKRFGTGAIMTAGSVLYLIVILIAASGHHILHYWWALVLLGVGWNFLFISGTSLLPQTYRHSERFKAQAVNDFAIFACQALASLSAGWLLFSFGWLTQVLLCLPFALLILLVALYHWYKPNTA